MDFPQADQAYQNLLSQRQSGQISDAEFLAAVQNLRIQTPDGNWWQKRDYDGAWLLWNGSSWIESQPQYASASKPQEKRKRKISCFRIFVIVLLSCICALVAVGAGGYYAYRTGKISQREILNILGLGSGEITIINITDDSINTELIRLDTESGSPELIDDGYFAPYEINGYGGIQPGEYEFRITSPSGIPPGGTCRMTISSGDEFQFVVVPSGIAITQEGVEVHNPDQIDMLTSGLCR